MAKSRRVALVDLFILPQEGYEIEHDRGENGRAKQVGKDSELDRPLSLDTPSNSSARLANQNQPATSDNLRRARGSTLSLFRRLTISGGTSLIGLLSRLRNCTPFSCMNLKRQNGQLVVTEIDVPQRRQPSDAPRKLRIFKALYR